ncbi:XRE family transcriptional regulator [Nocardia sp. NPDC019255]|uniref:XRE family transcriptional regulator n=1 Tax=Nocardia sp. NPDC019255 TaxID=3154591 RepID=UPI0033CBBB09
MILRDHKKLERLMVVQGVSHRQLAAAAGYKAHSHVGRLARGQARHVATDAALRIAHRLRVAVEDLFLPESTSNSGRQDHKKVS